MLGQIMQLCHVLLLGMSELDRIPLNWCHFANYVRDSGFMSKAHSWLEHDSEDAATLS